MIFGGRLWRAPYDALPQLWLTPYAAGVRRYHGHKRVIRGAFSWRREEDNGFLRYGVW